MMGIMQQHEPQHRPSRKDKKAVQVRRAIGLLAVLCVIMAGIGYAYFYLQANVRPIDSATFCPRDEKGPHSITAILIDLTDPFNITQQAALKDRLNDLKDRASQYDLLEIYSVEPTQTQLLKPKFSMCNPGRGEETNSWIGNPRLIEERWQKLFDAPLQNLFNSIAAGNTAAVSPIMESIQSIVVTKLGAQKAVEEKIPRRLIIISDLLQYVKDYSQYKHLGSFAQFRDTPYYQNVRSDLSGIDVEIWYVRRQNTLALQGEKHIDFWRDYLADQGGHVDKVWYVPGT